MKKTYIKTIIGTLIFALLITACSKFEQDFSRKSINELTVITDQTSFSRVQFESLKIPVEIQFSLDESRSYSYCWKAIGDDEIYSLSDEKELDVVIEIPPGTYDLQYEIKDNENNLAHSTIFQLTVNGAFYEGWLVSHNKNNKGVLSFVRSDNMVFEDPITEVNGTEFPGKSIAAFYSAIQFYNDYASIHYFTEEGVYRFDPNNFLLTGKSDDVLPGSFQFGNIAYGASILGADQYIINDGDIHVGMGSFYPEQILMPYSERLGGDYNLFPAVINTAQMATYFYDNKHKRFLQISYLEREISLATSPSESLFDLSNVGKTMIAAMQGRETFSSAIFYFVLEDESGRYFCGIDGNTPHIYQKVEDINCPDFSLASSFATSANLEHMYYTVDNKLYLYNMVANASELLYSFPKGQQIKYIEINRSTSKTLAVATLQGENGEFHLFDIDDLGHFSNDSPSYTKKGFGDIVHISLR